MILREIYIVGVSEKQLSNLQVRSTLDFLGRIKGKKSFLKGRNGIIFHYWMIFITHQALNCFLYIFCRSKMLGET